MDRQKNGYGDTKPKDWNFTAKRGLQVKMAFRIYQFVLKTGAKASTSCFWQGGYNRSRVISIRHVITLLNKRSILLCIKLPYESQTTGSIKFWKHHSSHYLMNHRLVSNSGNNERSEQQTVEIPSARKSTKKACP